MIRTQGMIILRFWILESSVFFQNERNRDSALKAMMIYRHILLLAVRYCRTRLIRNRISAGQYVYSGFFIYTMIYENTVRRQSFAFLHDNEEITFRSILKVFLE